MHTADACYHKVCLAKFSSNSPTQSTSYAGDSALDNLVKQTVANKERFWNRVDQYNLYGELRGIQHSRRSLLKTVSKKLYPELIVLSSPGVASILVFLGKAANQLHIVDDTED